MNSSVLIANIIRFFALVLIQVLILKNVDFGTYAPYFKVFLYPLFIFMLPLKLPTWASMLVALVFGLTIDMFYDSAGLHAGTCVAVAFARPMAMKLFEPRGGYDINQNPNKNDLGPVWFIQYAAVLMLVFVVTYFIFETFLFEKLGLAFIKAVLSYIVSFPVVLLFVYIFNPKY